ncbi:hypothetical protein [Marinivivus vitaminiproducens]|uniref:hypothetical protein n=1 Tax=Marinivivus vitaminiproducens TaxID=3035935 RepID=UPI0027A45174|nr:hypothetical protein P4R82_11010 [Geminicoccaceae bacterium SCSIO 64248]
MTRLFHLVLAGMMLLAGPVRAQDAPAPILEMSFPETETVPGQYLDLRLTVLVPTWLPKPVVFPTMEVPNLRVRLPERSTGPTSRRIGRQSWSGVTRHYLISPMVVGRFTIPAQDVPVTYAVAGSIEPVQAVLRTDPVTVSGTVPPGAEDLDPFIGATGLTLTQEVAGATTGLHPGDSIKRTVTARIEGASPIVIPPLLPETRIDGIAAYPETPAVAEREERGALSGSRTEAVTLMVQAGAEGSAPPVTLRWFNLATGRVETASVDGFPVSAIGPNPAPRSGHGSYALPAFALVAGLALFGLVLRFALPRLRARRQRRHERWRASKEGALRELMQTLRARDYPSAIRQLDVWVKRPPASDPAAVEAIRAAFTRIGAVRYGRSRRGTSEGEAWQDIERMIRAADRGGHGKTTRHLPPLNPGLAP